jgi:hypothetical protein
MDRYLRVPLLEHRKGEVRLLRISLRRSSLGSENQELLLESKCRIAPVLTLQASGRGAFSPECKHLFVVREHPRSRISIHRCYKGCWTGAVRGAEGAVSGGRGPWLCRILNTDFREGLFYALR